LLGLEFLVAADIIKTVAVDPTFAGAGVLVIIVIVRTFLSFTLELEISGRWPWQHAPSSDSAAAFGGALKRSAGASEGRGVRHDRDD
jgi:hypothetical protein